MRSCDSWLMKFAKCYQSTCRSFQSASSIYCNTEFRPAWESRETWRGMLHYIWATLDRYVTVKTKLEQKSVSFCVASQCKPSAHSPARHRFCTWASLPPFFTSTGVSIQHTLTKAPLILTTRGCELSGLVGSLLSVVVFRSPYWFSFQHLRKQSGID